MAFTLDAMSIYGQDTRILESWYSRQVPKPIETPAPSQREVPGDKPLSSCLLLAIPLEVRHQIYKYILPKTYRHLTKGIVWSRGSTALLGTNSQIHHEGSSLMYSTNIFAIHVIYDSTIFDYKWILENDLVPKRSLAFPEQIGARYIQLLRKIYVKVHHIDQYTGMIKYNYSGTGLTDGLRDQVQFLCQCLVEIPEINFLSILILDDTYTNEISQRVLEPFLKLKNIRHSEVLGDLSPAFSKMLSSSLKSNWEKKVPSLSNLPLEIRQQIYRILLDLFKYHNPSAQELIGQDRITGRGEGSLSALVALSWTSHRFYAEVQSFIFKNTHFKLSISTDLEYRFELQKHPTLMKRRVDSRPILLFPQDIYIPGFSNLRSLSINIDNIALSASSPRFWELGKFFDVLVSFLMKTSVQKLYVEYASDNPTPPKSSSRDPVACYARSLGITPHLRPTLLRTQSPSTRVSDVPSGSGEPTYSQLISRSPASVNESSPVSNTLLQTPIVSYLVAKLNPIMARIRNQKNGYVGFSQHVKPDTQNRLRLSDLKTARSPTDISNENSGIRQAESITTSLTATMAGSIPRTQSPRPPSSLESSSSRSSIKRYYQRDILFPDVPI